jgi:putative addiction module antidote
MVFELKLRKIGNSVGVILPKQAMDKLNVQAGDTLALTDGTGGSLRLTPMAKGHLQFTKQMKIAEKITRRYRNTLRGLAK